MPGVTAVSDARAERRTEHEQEADVAEWTRPKFAVDPDKTALVVIDMQNDFVRQDAPYESPAAREMIDDLNRLIGACRAHDIPIIFTAHAHRSDGSDLGAVKHIHPLTAEGPGAQGRHGRRAAVPEGRRRRHRPRPREAPVQRLLRHRPRAPAAQPRGRHADHRRRRHQRVLRVDDARRLLPGLQGDLPRPTATGRSASPTLDGARFSADDVQRYTLTNIATFYGEVAPISEVLERIERS